MTRTQYKDAIKRLGLTQAATAALLGYARRQPVRWASGEAPVPKLVGVVLNLLLADRITTEDLK